MDIEYLLFLQDFRNSIQDAWTPFLEWFSMFSTNYILLFPAFIYWCIDKRKGLFVFAAWKISVTINALVKLTCCIYRPWVRDPRILPAGDAIRTATGYSFPSGHTMMAAPIYGGLALLSLKAAALKALRFAMCALWLLAVLTTAFSRNYLGVHTPQDVIVGILLGFVSIYIAVKIFKYLDTHPERENLFLILGFLFALLTLIYVTYKPYPMDYVDGKLLVDPAKMQRDSWRDAGGLIAFVIIYWLEKTFIKFKATGLNLKGVILNLIGLIPLAFIIDHAERLSVSMLDYYWGHFTGQVILFGYLMLLWPAVLKLLGNKNKAQN
ncbi:MAG: phosphatase PAP2 family protein [Synergistaceae bacterium]|nr:phosphatase PAP2 family protein [Synergistaceae bacterium]